VAHIAALMPETKMDQLVCKTSSYLIFSVDDNIFWQPNTADFLPVWDKSDCFQCKYFISTQSVIHIRKAFDLGIFLVPDMSYFAT
jgi:hypothetical protein